MIRSPIRKDVSNFLGAVEADLHSGFAMREEVKVHDSVFDGFQETITSPDARLEVIVIHPDDEDDPVDDVE